MEDASSYQASKKCLPSVTPALDVMVVMVTGVLNIDRGKVA